MSFVPPDFEIPVGFEDTMFKARMLTVNDVVKDYDAVMSSVEHLRCVFGSDSTWPKADMSFEQDLIDLGWHQKEFQNRSSFAYTAMNPDESECLGCVYIYPSRREDIDAVVIMWVRKSAYDRGMDGPFEAAVRAWVTDSWPFRRVAYPGRE